MKLPALYALVLSAACRSPDRPTAAPPEPVWQPVEVTVALDAARAASAAVSRTGGIVEATGEDGTVYRLTLPPGAMASPITLTLTPVTRIADLPLHTLPAAVAVEPMGIPLLVPAILSVTPPVLPGPAGRVAFRARPYPGLRGASVVEAGLGWVPSAVEDASIEMRQTAVFGVGVGSAEQILDGLGEPGLLTGEQAEAILAGDASGVAIDGVVEAPTGEDPRPELFRAWYRDVVEPSLRTAAEPSAMEAALRSWEQWSSLIADFGYSEALEEDLVRGRREAASRAAALLDEEALQCRRLDAFPSSMTRLPRLMVMIAMSELEDEDIRLSWDAMIDTVRHCFSFRLEADIQASTDAAAVDVTELMRGSADLRLDPARMGPLEFPVYTGSGPIEVATASYELHDPSLLSYPCETYALRDFTGATLQVHDMGFPSNEEVGGATLATLRMWVEPDEYVDGPYTRYDGTRCVNPSGERTEDQILLSRHWRNIMVGFYAGFAAPGFGVPLDRGWYPWDTPPSLKLTVEAEEPRGDGGTVHRQLSRYTLSYDPQ